MNEINLLQSFIAGRLQSVAYFGDIAVAAPRLYLEGTKITTPKTINDKLDQVLNGLEKVNNKIGASVRVLQPVFNVEKKNLPGPQGRLIVPVLCQVHPIYNFSASGTGKYDLSIAIEVVRALHGFRVPAFAWSLYADGDTINSYFDDEKKFMTSEVMVHTISQIQPRTDVAKPVIAVDNDSSATITCATSGASIYYTLDGVSYPRNGETNATPYGGAFNAPQGTVILAAAYKTDLHGSEIANLTAP